MPEAAVVESASDQNITHSHQAQGMGWGMMGWGMIGGAILGAVVGVAVIGLATAAIIFTGGLAAPTLIPALILAGSIFIGAYLGGNLRAIHGSFQTGPKGYIRAGEAAILLNGKQAATAEAWSTATTTATTRRSPRAAPRCSSTASPPRESATKASASSRSARGSGRSTSGAKPAGVV